MYYAYFKWIVFFPVAITCSIIFRLLAPLVAIPVHQKYRVDTVKRFNKQIVGLDREYLLPCFKWFATHDNAADEWWWGCYNRDTWFAKNWTQAQYDTTWLIRYICRVAWLWRNSGYGFAWAVLGFQRGMYTTESMTFYKDGKRSTWYEYTRWINQDGSRAFKVKGYFYLTKTIYIDVNIGWKAHDKFDKLMYAGRLFAPRKNK